MNKMINYLMNAHKEWHAELRWQGWDTQRRYHWIVFADSYSEIWNVLCDYEVMHWDDFEKYQCKKGNINCDDYECEEDYEKALDDVEMTEEDFETLIRSCQSNAYYQEIDEGRL